MSAWQIDFKDASTVPADPYGKQQHVVEILNVVDMGTSIVVAAHVHANFHAQTALEAMAEVLEHHGKPDSITLDRDTRWVGSASGRDFPSAFLRFLLCLGIHPNVCPPHRPDLNAFVERAPLARSNKNVCWSIVREPRSKCERPTKPLCSITIMNAPIKRFRVAINLRVWSSPSCLTCHKCLISSIPMPGSIMSMDSILSGIRACQWNYPVG
jgi:hypothetical protein